MEYFLAEFVRFTNVPLQEKERIYRLVKASDQFEAEHMARIWAEKLGGLGVESFQIVQTIH